MKNRKSFCLLIFIFFGIGNLLGQMNQPLFSLEEEQELIEKFGENEDYREGIHLVKIGKPTEARLFFQKANDTFENKKQWDWFILSHSKLAGTYVSAADHLEGIEFLDTALKKIEISAPEYVKKTARLYHIKGLIYRSVFKPDQGLIAHKRQLELLQTYYPPDSNWEFVMANSGIARVYRTYEDYDTTLTYYLKANEVAKKLNHSNFEWAIRTYDDLANLYGWRLGQSGKAMKLYRFILQLALDKYGENAPELVDHYLGFAITLRNMQELELSLEYHQKALFIVEREDLSYRKREIFLGLGECFIGLGDEDQALIYFQKSLDEPIKSIHDMGYNISTTFIIGEIYRRKKEYDKTLLYLEKGDSLLQAYRATSTNKERIFHETRSYHWYSAKFWEEQGDLQKAKEHFLEMVNNYVIEGSEWHDSPTYKRLAAIFEREGLRDSAFYYNQKAVIANCENFKSLNPVDLPSVEDAKDFLSVYGVINQKIWLHTLAALDEKDQANKKRLFEEGLRVVDFIDAVHVRNMKNVNFVRGGNSNKMIESSLINYKDGLSLAYDSYHLGQLEEGLHKGFYYVQKMKSQNLWLSLLKSDAVSFGALDEALLKEERELLSKITDYENKLLKAREDNDTSLINTYQNHHLFELRKSFTDLQMTLETKYPEYFQSKYNFVPETEASLQNILEEGELLIEYAFTKDAIYAFTISENQPLGVHKILYDEGTYERIQKMNQLLQNSAMMRKTSREKFITLSNELYNQFLQPLEDQITGKTRLVVIGDGMTNYIPFEVLLSTKEILPFKDLNFLIQNYEISYHYTSTLFAKSRKKVASSNSGIYAFAPVFDQTVDEAGTASDDFQYNSSLRAINSDGNYTPLPESEKEVESIIKLFNERFDSTQNTLALRKDAQESALKLHLKNPYQFVHIAGHSFANMENPKFSGIACFDGKEDDEDGTLFTGEIYNLNSKADLVTLSSCESGFGKLAQSEGMLGLNRAFIYAGTPNVVFSLWKVYDKVSAQLMIDFYTQILDGKNYASSLRQAKLKLLENEATASPHFWSPYLLIGR